MFTAKEMLSLDYFNVLEEMDDGSWELQSKNTGHCWKLIYENHLFYETLGHIEK